MNKNYFVGVAWLGGVLAALFVLNAYQGPRDAQLTNDASRSVRVAASVSGNAASTVTDVVVKRKSPTRELFIFIHSPRPRAANNAGRSTARGATCPSKTLGRWGTNTLSFSVNPNGSVTTAGGTPLSAAEITAAVTAGFTPWDAASALSAPTVTTAANLPSSYVTETANGVNEIAWAPLSARGFANAIAVTYVWRNTATKRIVEADMINNSDAGFAWVNHTVVGDPDLAVVPVTGKFDVTNIDTHEFGHFVGLDHVQKTDHTIYGYSATDEVLKRSLECGDAQGVQKLYGA